MKAFLFVCLIVVAAYAQSDLRFLSDRDYVPTRWVKEDRAPATESMSVKIFLKQRNLDQLEELFWEVADPKSPLYGQHKSIDEILDLIAPSVASQNKVIAWLNEAGLSDIVNYRDSLKITGPVAAFETAFHTKIYNYRSVENEKKVIYRQYGASYVPSEIFRYIDVIAGLDTFPAFRSNAVAAKAHPISDVSPSQNYVLPQVILNNYNIPDFVKAESGSSVGLIEFQDYSSFNKANLVTFEQETDTPSTEVAHIVGQFSPSNPGLESTLDVQYAIGVTRGGDIWYWTEAEWLLDFAQSFFNSKTIPTVISMSWGWTPQDQCQITSCNGMTNAQYVSRTNVEWQKIGLRGVSVFAASGDQGAPGDGDTYCSTYGSVLNGIFPGDSPYVTSVGATMLLAANNEVVSQNKEANAPICTQYPCATSTSEAVCTYPQALITSGGGFGYYSPRPSYQDTVVSAYLKSGTPLPPSSYYNASNRAFPDVAALGHNYVIYANGWIVVDGTSCSTPVWAGMATLINDYRLKVGKSTLGFVNTLLYQIYASTPDAFTSIVSGPTSSPGNNKCTESCCDTYGYVAAKGWDPVTGLGTPNFQKLLTAALQA